MCLYCSIIDYIPHAAYYIPVAYLRTGSVSLHLPYLFPSSACPASPGYHQVVLCIYESASALSCPFIRFIDSSCKWDHVLFVLL